MHLAVFFRVASVARYCGHMIAGSLLGTTLGMFSSCFSIYYSDVIMSTMASQITSLTIVYSRLLYPRPTKLEGGGILDSPCPSVCPLFRCRSKKISKLCVTGVCEGNSPVTSEFPTQMASNEENVSIWWLHHANGQWDLENLIALQMCKWPVRSRKSHCTSNVNSYTCIYEPGHLSSVQYQSHYLNRCGFILTWTLWSKLQWNLNQNTKFPWKKIQLNKSSPNWHFCSGLNVFIDAFEVYFLRHVDPS